MLKQIWTVILLVICGVNAINVNDSSPLLADSTSTGNAQITLQQSMNIDSSLGDIVGDKDHRDSDHKNGNCGDSEKNCHQCHLGHCHFVLADTQLNSPDLSFFRIGVVVAMYTSVDLSTLQRPPLV